jgi:hypothetical protein
VKAASISYVAGVGWVGWEGRGVFAKRNRIRGRQESAPNYLDSRQQEQIEGDIGQ